MGAVAYSVNAGDSRKHARRLAVAGSVSLAVLAGLAVPAPASADSLLECKKRAPTVVSIPGVRGVGTSGADVIVGFPLMRDTLDGRGGNDLMCGLGRGDFLYGGTGDDKLRGNRAGDVLVGELGNDRLRGGADRDRMRGAAGFDRCVGGSGYDIAIDCEVVKSAVSR
jgi:hypothetical protein